MAIDAAGSGAVHVGTSGWTYDDWSGPFYPPGVRGAERLSYYAERFDTVEVNATFYRLPSAAMIASWNRRLPPGFQLVLKGSRLITHLRRLRDCADALETYFARAAPLERLAVVLWQLPPTLERDPGLLAAFLAQLPRAVGRAPGRQGPGRRVPVRQGPVRHAVEFRHASWWSDDVQALLARHGAAFVAVSHPELPAEVRPTGDLLYLRFHGLGPRRYDYDYSAGELRDWVRRVRPHLAGRTLYAFFNNDHRARAPRNAETFRSLLAAR
jgi:uncharacterized protein YecE (DUF72 family)